MLLSDEVVEKMGSGDEDTSEEVELSVVENTSLEEVVVVVKGGSSKTELENGGGEDDGVLETSLDEGVDSKERLLLSKDVVEKGGSSKAELVLLSKDVVDRGGSSKAEDVLLTSSLEEETIGALVGVPT